MRFAILILYIVTATLILVWVTESATATPSYEPPSIANVTVPSGLHCEEDEAITWIGVDTLGCVHMDTLYLDLAMERGAAGTPQPDRTFCDTLTTEIDFMIIGGESVIAGGELDLFAFNRCGAPQPKLPGTGHGP